MFPRMSTENKKSLQLIQNNAIRTIIHISKLKHLSTHELCAKSGLKSVEERAKSLNSRYFVRAIMKGNPLIINLIESKLSRNGSIREEQTTLLFDLKPELDTLLSLSRRSSQEEPSQTL